MLHNGTTTKYYNTGSQRVAMRTGSTLYYLLNDDLGGTSLVLTSGGGVQAVQLYAPYGAVRYSQGTVPTTYNYTGQRLDSETGLLYYGFRYYDPVVGQFVRADTTETNAGGMNGYGYVGENPETKNDPTGHYIVDFNGNRYNGNRGGSGGSGGSGNGGYGSPPVDNWWSDPSPSSNIPSGYSDTPDPNKFKVAGAVLRYGSLLVKLAIDGYILKNGAAIVADWAGAFSTVVPAIDIQEVLAGLFGLNNTNTGSLQAELAFKSATTSGWEPFAKALGHLALIGAVVYAGADLAGGQSNGWQRLSDYLTLASAAAFYVATKLFKKPPALLLALSTLLGVGATVMSAEAAVTSSPDNSDPHDRRRDDSSGGWGGGGFPPLPPVLPPFGDPQPAIYGGQPGINIGGPYI